MKYLLSLIALVAVTLPVATAVAEALGLALPVVVSAEIGLGLFVAAFSVLAFLSAYSAPRVARDRHRRSSQSWHSAPHALGTRSSRYHEAHYAGQDCASAC